VFAALELWCGVELLACREYCCFFSSSSSSSSSNDIPIDSLFFYKKSWVLFVAMNITSCGVCCCSPDTTPRRINIDLSFPKQPDKTKKTSIQQCTKQLDKTKNNIDPTINVPLRISLLFPRYQPPCLRSLRFVSFYSQFSYLPPSTYSYSSSSFSSPSTISSKYDSESSSSSSPAILANDESSSSSSWTYSSYSVCVS